MLTIQVQAALDLFTSKMHKGAKFSVKTLDSWFQAANPGMGLVNRRIVFEQALAQGVEQGLIREVSGSFAPGVTRGYVVA